jgi:hypothetical protein
MPSQFIRVQNRFVRVDSIAYVDFLESGRSMIFVYGLSQEKQHIALDAEDTRRLRAILEPMLVEPAGGDPNHEPAAFDRGPKRPFSQFGQR